MENIIDILNKIEEGMDPDKARGKMEIMWEKLKEKGAFPSFKTYKEWEDVKYNKAKKDSDRESNNH